MTTATFPERLPAVQEYTRLLLQLDDLMLQGRGNSDEADELRECMETQWYEMTDQERERVGGLSEDLYSIATGGPKAVNMSPPERAEYARAAKTALRDANDSDPALAFLRRPYPSDLPPDAVPTLQSRFWERLGDLEVALRFMREAERRNPKQAVFVLILLDKLGRHGEVLAYARRILADQNASREELYFAAASRLRDTLHASDADAKPILESIFQGINRAWKMAGTNGSTTLDVTRLETAIAQMLALVYERLGKQRQAIEVYDKMLSRFPRHSELLAGRGIARYDLERGGALSDFEAARQAGTTSIWPFFFLAGHALEQGNYHLCWRLCVEGLDCPGPVDARAQLHQWLGIAQSMLGQPLERVLECFEHAERLDPDNETIRTNRKVAEARLDGTPEKRQPWKTTSLRISAIWPARVVHGFQDELEAKRSDDLLATLSA